MLIVFSLILQPTSISANTSTGSSFENAFDVDFFVQKDITLAKGESFYFKIVLGNISASASQGIKIRHSVKTNATGNIKTSLYTEENGVQSIHSSKTLDYSDDSLWRIDNLQSGTYYIVTTNLGDNPIELTEEIENYVNSSMHIPVEGENFEMAKEKHIFA